MVIIGPAQASTLVSDIMTSIPQLVTPECVVSRCGGAQEPFNPACNSNCHVGVDGYGLHQCGRWELATSNIWNNFGCTEDQWEHLLHFAVSHNITYGKENFSPMRLPKFVQSGFEVFVSYKPPWDTFPTQAEGIKLYVHHK